MHNSILARYISVLLMLLTLTGQAFAVAPANCGTSDDASMAAMDHANHLGSHTMGRHSMALHEVADEAVGDAMSCCAEDLCSDSYCFSPPAFLVALPAAVFPRLGNTLKIELSQAFIEHPVESLFKPPISR